MTNDSITIEIFPSLTRKIIKEAKFGVSTIEAYDSAGRQLNIDKTTGKLSFESEAGDWSMEKDGLTVSISVSMSNPHVFYGDGGVAGHGTELGIAAVVKSPTSCRRDTFDSMIRICEDTDPVNSFLVVNLSSEDYHGTATVDVVLYVKKPGSDSRFASESGYILGVLQSYVFSLDGNSSIFPIDTISSDQGFLWRLECDYSDVTVDRFDQSIALVFNENHPRYGQLEIEKMTKSMNVTNVAFLSILSHAIQILVQNVLREYNADRVISGEGLSEGSVGAAVHYFITTFGPSFDDPVELAYEIEKYLFPVVTNDGE